MSQMDNYIRGKVLGKGSFGSAVLVTSKKDGKQYVIKEIDMTRMPAAEREASKQEASLLIALKHPNIVRAYDSFTWQNKLCIVMEFCSEGDLYGLVQKKRGMLLSEDTVLDWFVQLCLGLKHVHDRKIVHRDIKTQNVFVSTGGLLKIGDFGVSKILANTFQLAATAVGTPYYLSPEICQNKKYNQKSDIWSLGCVLYELATMKHAFEAPSMRALIQKIIKGQYTPLPATRSKELRDLVDRMLTLDSSKRPSINDLLSTPVMKARIQRFLTSTIQQQEFSHTIIHGRPQPGQIVVGAGGGGGGGGGGDRGVNPSAPASSQQQQLPPRPGVVGASPVRPSAPLPVAAAPSAANRVSPSQARPGSGNAPAPAPAASPIANRAPSPSAQREAAAALAAAAARKEEARREAAAALAARQQKEDEARRAQLREAQAAQAQREAEKMKIEEQRRKMEQERLRKKAQEEEERKAREAEAKRRKAEEDARKKEADRIVRERERQEMQDRIAAQRKELYERQQAAARNKEQVEGQLGRGPASSPAQAPKPRKQWQNVIDDAPNDYPEQQQQARGGGGGEPRPRDSPHDLSPEQRRAAWEEMKAAAERNRRKASEGDVVDARGGGGGGGGGGLAAFLGVPQDDPPRAQGGGGGGRERVQDQAGPQKGAQNQELTDERRRQEFFEAKAAAERNRRQAEGDLHGPPPSPPPPQKAPRPPSAQVQQRDAADYYERRRAKLEEEQAKREAEIREFQRQHYREMREAAARNKMAVMGEVNDLGDGGGGAGGGGRAPVRAPSPSSSSRPTSDPTPPSSPPPPLRDESPMRQPSVTEPEDDDFAAMVKDMEDILEGSARKDAEGEEEEEPEEEEDNALAGRFVLNGQEVELPVHPSDPLGVKVEALRMFLEDKLGTGTFLKVYRKLESLNVDDDEGEVSKEFLQVLGQEKLPYLHLVHQLIVCEESWAEESHR